MFMKRWLRLRSITLDLRDFAAEHPEARETMAFINSLLTIPSGWPPLCAPC